MTNNLLLVTYFVAWHMLQSVTYSACFNIDRIIFRKKALSIILYLSFTYMTFFFMLLSTTERNCEIVSIFIMVLCIHLPRLSL